MWNCTSARQRSGALRPASTDPKTSWGCSAAPEGFAPTAFPVPPLLFFQVPSGVCVCVCVCVSNPSGLAGRAGEHCAFVLLQASGCTATPQAAPVFWRGAWGHVSCLCVAERRLMRAGHAAFVLLCIRRDLVHSGRLLLCPVCRVDCVGVGVYMCVCGGGVGGTMGQGYHGSTAPSSPAGAQSWSVTDTKMPPPRPFQPMFQAFSFMYKPHCRRMPHNDGVGTL